PEMLGGPEPRLSERTDVYLLGAILHEIMTGRPPHTGASLADVVDSALASRPLLPDTAPPGLARICERAMAAAPEDRFGSAEELRDAILAFLRRRGSERLAEQARSRQRELERMIAGAGAGASIDRQLLYNHYG